MALVNGTPNPLNYFDLRRVVSAPPHFKYFTVPMYSPRLKNQLENWIKHNLNNRYYISQSLTLDKTNTIVYNTLIGFEDELERTYFILGCPYITK